MRECTKLQSDFLIVQQMVLEYKEREFKLEEQMKEDREDLIEQLNRKEYVIQSYYRHFRRCVQILKSYAHKDFRIKELFNTFNIKADTEFTITNIVDQNKALIYDMKTARMKMKRLELQLVEIKRESTSMRKFKEPGLDKSFCANDLASTEHGVADPVEECRALRLKVEELTRECSELKEEVAEVRRRNEVLAEGLRRAKAEVSKLKGKIFKMESVADIDISFAAIEDKEKEERNDGSFEMSSVEREDVNEFMNN
eukprot:TRINITY_DN2423_c0_g4_i1.p1 TRINITY_DN2423_c0_g4~~TRINITY_DN2423_c0_g4_i1.p1  ORF type:complete len:255 (-),score=105.30 TRINITY_DN2423_c0_g4_i1:104-868(-)